LLTTNQKEEKYKLLATLV